MSKKLPMTKIVRQLRNGRVTIPSVFRKELGIGDDSLLQMTLIGGEVRIKPVRVRSSGEGSPWLKELYQQFAPVREEAARYTEAQIDADVVRAAEQASEKREP